MTSIQIIDRATGSLKELEGRIRNPMPGLMIAGRAVSNLLRTHFQHKNDSQPNKMGGTRQNFWLQVKRGVNVPQATGASQVTVSISHPAILQKIKGGTITAKRAGALTIPVRPEAYGRTASVLEHALGIKLFLIKKAGKAFLAGRTDKDVLRIFYVLKKSVTQKPDPTALPPQEQMEKAAMDAWNIWAGATSSQPQV